MAVNMKGINGQPKKNANHCIKTSVKYKEKGIFICNVIYDDAKVNNT